MSDSGSFDLTSIIPKGYGGSATQSEPGFSGYLSGLWGTMQGTGAPAQPTQAGGAPAQQGVSAADMQRLIASMTPPKAPPAAPAPPAARQLGMPQLPWAPQFQHKDAGPVFGPEVLAQLRAMLRQFQEQMRQGISPSSAEIAQEGQQ